MYAVTMALGVVTTSPWTLAATSEPVVVCDPKIPDKCMCDGQPIGHSTWAPPAWLMPKGSSIYDMTATLGGSKVPLSTYKAKVAMVANVASA